VQCKFYIYSHNKIYFLPIHDKNMFCTMSVLRRGKLHPSNAAVLKLLVLLANSASKVLCQWVVIERNGSYRLISCTYNRRSRTSRSVIFRAIIYTLVQRARWSKRRRARELFRSGTFSKCPECRSRPALQYGVDQMQSAQRITIATSPGENLVQAPMQFRMYV